MSKDYGVIKDEYRIVENFQDKARAARLALFFILFLMIIGIGVLLIGAK